METAGARTRRPTLIDAVLRVRWPQRWLLHAALVILGSVVVALTAQISVPLPFTPVPLTGQTFGVLLTGALLGSRRGAAALLLYLLEGAGGLPVFAGGTGGWAHLLGPTGGYLFSYPLAAGLMGFFAERGWDRKALGTAAGMLLSSLLIFLLGAAWLATFVGGFGAALARGVLPFLPGDFLKALLAAALLPGGWKLLGRRG
jgi:biotin transport system substrate-specific component